jgi:Fe2+ transport system protein FeoA
VSEDDRRGGWLSRVFGASGEPPLTEVILQLESELAALRSAHDELTEAHRARGDDLDASRVAAGRAEALGSQYEAELAVLREDRLAAQARRRRTARIAFRRRDAAARVAAAKELGAAARS